MWSCLGRGQHTVGEGSLVSGENCTSMSPFGGAVSILATTASPTATPVDSAGVASEYTFGTVLLWIFLVAALGLVIFRRFR